jgi:hypothetical protein
VAQRFQRCDQRRVIRVVFSLRGTG